MILLRHLSGPLQGQETRSRGAELRIGRDDDNDVVLRGPKISKLHARIRFQNQWYELVDENSLNGTWLNSEEHRLEGPRRIREHDVIRLGSRDGPSVEVCFEYDRARYTASQAPPRVPIATIWLALLAVMALVLVAIVGILVLVLYR